MVASLSDWQRLVEEWEREEDARIAASSPYKQAQHKLSKRIAKVAKIRDHVRTSEPERQAAFAAIKRLADSYNSLNPHVLNRGWKKRG